MVSLSGKFLFFLFRKPASPYFKEIPGTASDTDSFVQMAVLIVSRLFWCNCLTYWESQENGDNYCNQRSGLQAFAKRVTQ
jgi:hypothetical protein